MRIAVSPWGRILPDWYQVGEFPGETFPEEVLRRVSCRLVPKSFLDRSWKRILLGDDGLWCLILGVNNSGTTLLERLLDRHLEVRTLPPRASIYSPNPEAGGFGGSAPLDRETGSFSPDRSRPRWAGTHSHSRRGLSLSGTARKGAPGEEPPNTIRSRWLQEYFPRPRFIALFRHPCAVAEGVHRREGHELRDAARHWARANEILLEDAEHLDRLVQVRYERLCGTPRAVMEHLAGFLALRSGLAEEDLDGLDVHSLDDSVETIENFNPRSFRHLSSADMDVIAEEAGEVADRLGYRIPPSSRDPG